MSIIKAIRISYYFNKDKLVININFKQIQFSYLICIGSNGLVKKGHDH